MGSVYEVFRENPGGAYMQWLFIMFFLVAMPTMDSFVQTKDYISKFDMPIHRNAALFPVTQAAGVFGKTGSLPCDTQPLSPDDRVMMVLWFKGADWKPLYSYDVRNRSTNLPKLWSAPTGFGSRAFFRAAAIPSTLLIDNVGTNDSGLYRCRVYFKNSPARNLKVNFTFIIPPNRPIIMEAKTKDPARLLGPYNEGDTLELLCVVDGGYPRPSLIWYLENTIIDDTSELKDNGVTKNTLIIPSISRQHLNLRLTCEASNTNLVPPQSELLILDINVKPLTVQILNKQKQLSADSSYEVECKTTGSRPEAQVTWWKGALPLSTKNTKTYFDTNTTTSLLVFIPEAENHDVELICRAENPRVADSVIEDTWRLNVHYVPIVNLKMGSYLKPTYIKEGDDVFFECYVEANPKATKLSWIKDCQEIQQNASSGIILNGQSLVLQGVDFSASGDYTCLAENSKGSASSNPVSLEIRYSPVCNSEEGQVWGASRFEPIELSCIVDSSPQPTSFEWAFNRNHYYELLPSLNIVKGHKSILRYIPSENRDFGTLSCWATNEVGRQEIPCTYKVVLEDRPSSLQNCSIGNQSLNSILVDCLEGFDGGLQQVFIMEVMELPSFNIRANITSNTTPNFEVAGLDRGLNYSIYLFSANAKGRSEVVTIYTALEDKYAGIGSAFALSPVTASLLAVAAIMVGAAAAVSVAVYRRNSASRHTEQSVPPLHSVDSVESLPKRDNLPPNMLSQKVDYNTQYELKANGEVEDDPDMFPVHHDKKPLDDNCKSKVGEGSTVKIYSDHAASLPNNGNISFVNRGVTARECELCFCESCIQNHLQSTRF